MSRLIRGQTVLCRVPPGQSVQGTVGNSAAVTAEIGIGSAPNSAPYYDGAYDVTPLITAQRLATSRKLMRDDVRIDMIPTREIANDAGGVTFIVGG